MGTAKLDILWSPKLGNKFITFGTDVKLYQFDIKANAYESGSEEVYELLASNSDIQYLKCVSWSPREDYDSLLAVGQQNGKVLLTSFNQYQDPSQLIGKEFVPKHSRQLNCLSWNPVEKNLLAAGMEKGRNECSLLIWDVLNTTSDPDRRSLSNSCDNSVNQFRLVAEFGSNETTHSFHWLTKEAKTIIAGVNNKQLKICDIRDNNRQPTVTSTKAVHGVCVDLFHMNWVASYYEHQVVIWDIRNFEKPMMTMNDTQPISKIEWCRTRANLLASVARDSHVVKLYDIQQTGIGNDELEPIIVERSLIVPGIHPLMSFSWHPSNENSIMTVDSVGSLHHQVVCERITLNWSPTSKLVWSHGKKILQYIDQNDEVYNSLDDISVKMRQRAIEGYGLEMQQLWKNGDIVKSDKLLHNLWGWLDTLVKNLREESKSRNVSSSSSSSAATKTFTSQTGVHSLIRNDSNTFNGGAVTRSDMLLQSWEGIQGKTIKIYKSCDRDRALQLCKWNFDKEGINLAPLLDGLEAEGCYQRAATIAVFNSKILKAIQILKKGASMNSQKGGDTSLYTVAMALSGYTTDKNSLWREMCDKLRFQLQDPYLRAMFAFLTCDNDSYEDVLNETGVTVNDRVAFACIFLPDNKLIDFLDRLTKSMIETGSLDGMLLTGLSKEGLDLLQRYVDMTGDVQTASLIVVQSLPSDAGSEHRALQWIECYRELLDQWRLWQQRAHFDVNWHKTDTLFRPSPQVFISCNYCGKPISALMQCRGVAGNFGGALSNKSKITCCPNCRKPLPRCSLCLIHMGTPTAAIIPMAPEEKIVVDEQKRQKLSLFLGWFTWCQSCRHGGHANHITAWFKEHPECPVTACNCKCMALDSANRS